MVFGAHADDVEILAGGTFAKYIADGYEGVYVCVRSLCPLCTEIFNNSTIRYLKYMIMKMQNIFRIQKMNPENLNINNWIMKDNKIHIRQIVLPMGLLCSFTIFCLNLKATERPIIYPFPQQAEVTGDVFILDKNITIIVPPQRSENDIFLGRFLVRELSDKYGIAVKIEQQSVIPEKRKVVIMGKFNNPLIRQYCKENNIDINEKDPGPEGYILTVSSDKIIIAGSDEAGAFYGLQSLRQLIDAGDGQEIRGINIRDWPEFTFRAIRLYVPGPENIAFFKRFLRDFMSMYKFNKVIMEVNCMRLDKHPEVNAGWIEFSKYMQYTRSNSTEGICGEEKNSSHYDAGDGYIIEKNDIRSMVTFARENFIEVIPEIPSLTHGYYLLTKHPELAEYPGDRWPDTYCPSNPESYKLMFDVYDEYIDVIKPKMIHIGHDEWWGAPLGVCPLCRGKDFSELFSQDINKIHDYLAGKGVKIAMWGDYLLESVRNKGPQHRVSSTGIKYQTPGGIRPEVVRNSIPKDILVFNWFWRDPVRDGELQDFGFQQIYGNFKPNISNWDERVKKIDLQGGAPSSWAATNEFNIGKDLIYDFLGCANLIWSSHTVSQKELVTIVAGLMPDVRTNLSGKRFPSRDGDDIETIDISSAMNAPKGSEVFNVNMDLLKSGRVGSSPVFFDLPGPVNSPDGRVVVIGTHGEGDNPLPSKSKGIPVNDDVSSLIFLHACALPSENQKAYFNIPDFFDTSDLLGWYEIEFEDGFISIVPIQYGVNILEWIPGADDRFDKREGKTGSAQNLYCYQADQVNCSGSKEKPITFYAFEWINPRFGKKIQEVRLNGTVNYMATQTNYGKPEYAPLKSNAIMLAGLSKVVKRQIFHPETGDSK